MTVPGGPCAGDGLAGDHLTDARCRHEPVCTHGQVVDGRTGHLPERHHGGRRAIEVGERELLQREQHMAARPERAGEWMPHACRHEVGAAGDDARLGPTEQLVATEGDQGCPGSQ
jgi:hypothetical protein